MVWHYFSNEMSQGIDNSTKVILVSILLIIIPFMAPNQFYSLSGDIIYETTYPAEPGPDITQYDIYIGRNEYGRWKFYIDPIFGQEFDDLQYAMDWIDEANAGNAVGDGSIQVTVMDGTTRLQGASVILDGTITKESSNMGTITFLHVELKQHTYRVEATGFSTSSTKYVTLVDPGVTLVEVVYLDRLSVDDPEPTPDPDPVPDFVTVEITISEPDGGTIKPSPGNYVIYRDETMSFTATADETHEFVHWTKNGAIIGTTPKVTFTVKDSAIYTAIFAEREPTELSIPLGYYVIGLGVCGLIIGVYMRKRSP